MQKNLILIGAGRSGTTWLSRILKSHPSFFFAGETDFLIPRLWSAMWDNRFWFYWPLFVNSDPKGAIDRRSGEEKFLNLRHEIDIAVSQETISDAQRRVGEAIRQSCYLLLGNDEQKKFWGFKEIWNGGNTYKYDWLIYDHVFPDAYWLHIVRNPFDYAKSNCRWNRQIFTETALLPLINEWYEMVLYNRKRQLTSRYFEITYEDLGSDPKKTLEPLFEVMGIQWCGVCESESRERVLPSELSACSKKGDLTKECLKKIAETIPDIVALCDELGYDFFQSRTGFFDE